MHASGRLRKNKRVASSCPSFDSVHRAERAEALMKGIRTILSGASGAGVYLLEKRGSHTLSTNRIFQNEIYFASRATRAEDRPLRSGIGSLVCVDPYGLTWFCSGRRSSNFSGGKSRFGAGTSSWRIRWEREHSRTSREDTETTGRTLLRSFDELVARSSGNRETNLPSPAQTDSKREHGARSTLGLTFDCLGA